MTAAEVGEVVDGRYQLEELIGKGGMGLVFRARHVFAHQQVALKLITDGLDPDTMTRFLDEARVAATIGHPAIVSTSDANRTADGQLYIVMELLLGRSLRSAMVAGLTSDDVKRIALELLDAIEAAHAGGVVHRDLKPENIYLVAPTSAVKVLDFGIAKMRGGKATAQGIVLGTLEYMAPEQLVDPTMVDARADLWAVGVILYELVSGVRPYRGTREELFDALANREPTPISAVAPVADELAAFFATALARDPAMRFQTAAQMIATVRRLTLARAGEATGTPIFNTAGPTMGTGIAWVQPASSPPNLATRSRETSAPPPVSEEARAPHAFASTVAQSVTPAPRSRKPRAILLGVAAIAIVIVIIALIRRSDDDKIVIVDRTVPAPARCVAACKKLATCGLAQATCEADCDRNLLRADCIEAAPDCTQAVGCVWQQTCGAPPSGARGCTETLACHQTCGLSNTACLCECNRQMSPPASLAMGRLFTCHQNNPTNEQFTQHCLELAATCQSDGPSVVAPATPSPVSASCRATCERLAGCGLEASTCGADCEAGRLDLPCLNAATTCPDRARCAWKQLCGHVTKSGGASCSETIECWGKHAANVQDQCSQCYDQMTPSAALEFGRYYVCYLDVIRRATADRSFDSTKMMTEKCQPLMMQCYGVK